MRTILIWLTVVVLAVGTTSARAVDMLTIQDKTVNAGDSFSLNVVWSAATTALNDLSTEFILTAVNPATMGEVAFSTPVAMPDLNALNYVFYEDSSDYKNSPTTNPATVYTTNWTNDTYNMADSMDSNTPTNPAEYTQDGSRLWTVLNLTTTGLAAGQYKITLGNSLYSNLTTTSGTPSIIGGLITVNAVPEPSTCVLTALALLVTLGVSRRKQI